MSTAKMYWANPYGTDFSATVLDIWQEDDDLFLVLDKTFFYPEGGGQPCDLGIIVPVASLLGEGMGNIDEVYRVRKVFEDDGRIIHVMGQAGLSKGQTVFGRIDWDRRFDFMQQHTGQHILSRGFEELLGAQTIGFHLGDDYVSIDLDAPSIEDGMLMRVEDLTNEIVYKNLPVEVKEYTQSQVPSAIRMRIPTDADSIRVVHIGDFDACACGGTHVKATGEIGIVKINQTDRSHGGVRVIFRCGRRALLDLREKEQILLSTSQMLSVSYKDLYETVVSVLEDANRAAKDLRLLKKEILEYEVKDLIEKARTQSGSGCFVCRVDGKDVSELKIMCKKICDCIDETVVLFSCVPQFSLVVACPDKAVTELMHLSPCLDASAIVKNLAHKWGLKGGGTPQIAQMGSKEPMDKSEEVVLGDLLETMEKLKGENCS
ncbi:MAG TPA: DHHA1 domain-containing protein [Bacillota bacterium]|nr:DHHA1 domain-containing protein [Bacillota bacterium]HOL12130.1 DHHA1 domain-containing protein [Bacillota bacterium]